MSKLDQIGYSRRMESFSANQTTHDAHQPTILVVCANPLLNLVYRGEVRTGHINRVSNIECHAEGKGVNVARVLSRLGHRVILTGFAGGHSGAWLREIVARDGIEASFIETQAPLRMGFMGGSADPHHPTSVLPYGFPLTDTECQRLQDNIRARLGEVQLVIISGSSPDPEKHWLYIDPIRSAHQAQVPCWLDAHGAALKTALSEGAVPDLAKPNREEWLESTLWGQIPELHITDGDQPAEIRIPGSGAFRVHPPQLNQVNPIGSGDCYVAGLAHARMKGYTLMDSLRWASAAGAANALREDVAMITPAEIEAQLHQVQIASIT
jgi:fructose-1-phosphate kinase PfkB-like protein